MEIRSFGDYQTKRNPKLALVCVGPSRTVQSSKDDADINVIVKRFGVTGLLPVRSDVPTYGEFDAVFDFQSAMNVIRRAQLTFESLPADVRKRFGNDPKTFVDFASDKANIDELRKMGLAPKVAEVVDAVAKGGDSSNVA